MFLIMVNVNANIIFIIIITTINGAILRIAFVIVLNIRAIFLLAIKYSNNFKNIKNTLKHDIQSTY